MNKRHFAKFVAGAALGVPFLGVTAAQALPVIDGGFESSTLGPWHIVKNGNSAHRTSSHPYTGVHDLKVTLKSDKGVFLLQEVQVQAGREYDLSAEIENRGSTGYVSLRLFTRAAASIVPGRETTYHKIGGEVLATRTRETFYLLLLAPGARFLADDIALTPVPEIDPRYGALPVAFALASLMLLADRGKRTRT